MPNGGPAGDGQQSIPEPSGPSLLGLIASLLATNCTLEASTPYQRAPRQPAGPGLHRELFQCPHAHQGFSLRQGTLAPGILLLGFRGWVGRPLLKSREQPPLPKGTEWAGLTVLGGV